MFEGFCSCLSPFWMCLCRSFLSNFIQLILVKFTTDILRYICIQVLLVEPSLSILFASIIKLRLIGTHHTTSIISTIDVPPNWSSFTICTFSIHIIALIQSKCSISWWLLQKRPKQIQNWTLNHSSHPIKRQKEIWLVTRKVIMKETKIGQVNTRDFALPTVEKEQVCLLWDKMTVCFECSCILWGSQLTITMNVLSQAYLSQIWPFLGTL